MEMKKNLLKGLVTGLLVLGMAGLAQAAPVTFSNITDGDLDPTKGFNVNTTSQSGNTLLNIGISDFKADGAILAYNAFDTLSLRVTAPVGYVITDVTITEWGNGETTNGIALSSGSITADGTPKNLPSVFFGANSGGPWTTGSTVDVARASEIDVSIVNSLFASTYGGPGDEAWISKRQAHLQVGLSPVPVPAAIWLLGSGLAGLIGFRIRLKKNA